MKTYLDGRLIVRTGDITEMPVGAVVNAANSSLLGGGGVDGAIHRKGGSKILDECRDIRQHRYPDGLPAGKAVITAAGDMPAKYVIHTVGPIWNDGKSGEKMTLANAYKNSLKLATETGIQTIAFPAISTGVYGFPKELAAPIVYTTIKEYIAQNSLPREVHLVFFSASDMELFSAHCK
jgi:O-acetyl-ADP-ribose deacetylase (regulator of RNase III)